MFSNYLKRNALNLCRQSSNTFADVTLPNTKFMMMVRQLWGSSQNQYNMQSQNILGGYIFQAGSKGKGDGLVQEVKETDARHQGRC